MKKTSLSLFTLLFLASCGGQVGKTSFQSVKKEVSQFNHEMLISAPGTQFSHIATIAPSVVDSEPLQATGLDKNGDLIYIVSNTQGDIIRGGLDIVKINTLGNPQVISSLVSNQSEYAEIKYKDGYVFMVGQKAGSEKNDAVLTVVNVTNTSSPSVSAELLFTDGYYATSIDIEGNLAYITVPNVGLKVVNISNPNALTLQASQSLSSSSTGAILGLIPTGVEVVHQVTSDWNASYNYQIQIKNNGLLPILNWTLCFNYDHVVGPTVWNASLDSSSAQPSWKINPMSYNQIIYPGSNVTIGWTGTPGGVNGDILQNIQFKPEGNASCAAPASSIAFENALFVRRHNAKSLVLGGADTHKLISHAGASSLVKNISSQIQEAPSRFALKGNSFFSNAGNSGLTIIDGLNASPSIAFQEAIPGTGNGLAVDACDRLYLAQGESGLQVVNAANHSSPQNLGYFDYADDAGSANNVFNAKINGINYVFVADGRGGVKIIKVISQSCPGEVVATAGVSCKVYDFAPGTPSSLPDMASMIPVGSFVTEQFDVANQGSENSFPLFPEELKYLKTYYGLLCEGKFTPSAGVASIKLSSDDGSRLSLDGVVVIDHDGLHGSNTKEASMVLLAKPYDFKLEYFQGPASSINLELKLQYLLGSENLLKNLSH